MKKTKLFAGFSTLLLAPGLGIAAPAQAHDTLIEAHPGSKEVLDEAPTEARLTFSGRPLHGQGLNNQLIVIDEDGNQWQDGEVEVEDFDLAADLCPGLPQGDYTLRFRVIYSDGHTGEGRYEFSVADSEAPESGTPQDCGVIGDGATDTGADSESSGEDLPQAADAQSGQADANGIPVWIWIVGGLGVLIVAVAVIVLARKPAAPAADED